MAAAALGNTPGIRGQARAEGKRLDVYLASRFTDYSRRVIQKIIDADGVLVNGRLVKASYRVRPGDVVSIRLPELPDTTPKPEDIPIEVVYEDEVLTVVNKPPGMVTHPARGNWRGTLVNALQFHYDTLSTLAGENRPGIVHRLDRDTTGLLVVVKDEQTHRKLAVQFELREVHKEYLALVSRRPGARTATTSSSRSASIRRLAKRWRFAAARTAASEADDVLRGPGAVSRFRPGSMQAADRPDPPDPSPSHPHRPPDPGRQALLGARPRSRWRT